VPVTGLEAPVAIVGAGPVGMTAALFLARHGLRSLVLESQESMTGQGSRSICVQRDVLDIFDRLGCGRTMADRGVSWTVGRTYYRDVELFQIRFPEVGRDAFPPFVNLPQAMMEEYLLDRLRGEPLIDLRWKHRVESLTQEADRLRLVAATPEGPVEVLAEYAIGCDGARSAMRRLLGIDFPGHSFEDRFLIADVRAKLPFPDERRFFFDPSFNPGRQVLVHPQPDSVWRIDWQVPADVDAEQERSSGRLDQRIRAVLGDAEYEIVWLSTYRFHQRVAATFQAGRAAGDLRRGAARRRARERGDHRRHHALHGPADEHAPAAPHRRPPRQPPRGRPAPLGEFREAVDPVRVPVLPDRRVRGRGGAWWRAAPCRRRSGPACRRARPRCALPARHARRRHARRRRAGWAGGPPAQRRRARPRRDAQRGAEVAAGAR